MAGVSKGSITLAKGKKRARSGESGNKRDARKAAPQSGSEDSASESEDLDRSEQENEIDLEDDEQDLADVSSGEEKAGSEEEEEDDDDDDDSSAEGTDDEFPLKKKSKNSKHDDGSREFSSAVNAILSSHLKAYDRKDPIMARNKKVLKKNEADKLEAQAKKAILTEKKKLLDKARKRDIIPRNTADTEKSGEEIRAILEKESKLRKIAQKGVVKLFNAILSTQVKTDKEVNETLGGVKNKEERKSLITEVSKEKFLDLVKAAATED